MIGSENNNGIAIAGSLVADVFNHIETYPAEGNLTHILDTEFHAGGIGNISLQLARLLPEVPIIPVGITGTDEYGDQVTAELSRCSNVRLDQIVHKGLSSCTQVMCSADTKERTFFSRSASSKLFDETYIHWNQLSADLFVYQYLLSLPRCDRYDPDFGTHAAKILHTARMCGMRTAADMVSKPRSGAREIVACALPYVDYFVVNEVEAEIATGIHVLDDAGFLDKKACLQALLAIGRAGVSRWAIIHTPRCAYGIDFSGGLDSAEASLVRVESLQIPREKILGTTGAGDAYLAGVVATAYQGANLKRAMRLGAATAGLSLFGKSSYETILPEASVWDFEATHRTNAHAYAL